MAHVPTQLAFEGADFEPSPRRAVRWRSSSMDPVFFGFRPDAEAGARIERLIEGLRRRYPLREASLGVARFHVSTECLGDGRTAKSAILHMAEAVASRISSGPFEISFNRVRTFPRRAKTHPLVLCGTGVEASLSAVCADLGAAMARAGLVAHGFTPHLTLLYDRTIMPEEAVEPVGWTVRELVLIETLVGQRRQVELARWPLRG